MFGIPFAFSKELAKVNDYVIQDKDFLSRIKLLPARGRANLDRERFLKKMIDEELILREAQRANLHEKEEYKIKVESFKRELLVDLYLQQYMKEMNTEEKQRKFFEENKEKRYTNPEAVRISVINVQSAEEAKEILEKVKAGEDFGELAKKYSKGPAASEGGDFGFRTKKGLRREFADRAFLMKIGEVSDLIEAKDGYHIVKVTERRDEG
ncbi:MAG: peptidylprolyl isomerase, partial [Nitrospirota bacterium]